MCDVGGLFIFARKKCARKAYSGTLVELGFCPWKTVRSKQVQRGVRVEGERESETVCVDTVEPRCFKLLPRYINDRVPD